MERVNIYHPVTGGRANVPASSVPQHRKAGWRVEKHSKQHKPPASQPTETEEETSHGRNSD